MPMLLVASSLMANGWAQRRSSTKRTSTAVQPLRAQSVGSVSVALTRAPDGAPLSGQQVMDLGAVSYGTGARVANVTVNRQTDRFVVATKFGLTIQDSSGRFSSAAVLVSLANPESVYGFRVDGVKLATTPQLLQGRARIGPTLAHRLEIEVPVAASEKDSQFHNAIVLQVIPN